MLQKFSRKVNLDFLGSDFYGRIVHDADIPSNYIRKDILAASDFAKKMQRGIKHYFMKDRINNVSFR